MSGSMYLVRDGDLVAMHEGPYVREADLQEWIAQHPALLAGEQINSESPRRWLLVAREIGVPAEEGGAGWWSLDHLFLDQDAVPTLVEVKRRSDTRIRREVVGQMLDYAANGTKYWPVEKIRAEFIANCERHGADAATRLADFLGPDAESEAFWQTVKENLETGRLRLIFVSDAIPPELRRVIEFLNDQMTRTEVLALEVKQYVGQGQTTLVPRVVGQTERAQQQKTASPKPASTKRYQDEQTFFAELRRARTAGEVAAMENFYRWATEHGLQFSWGTGQMGSMIPVLSHGGIRHYFGLFWTNGKIYVNFRDMRPNPPFSDPVLREDLRRRLDMIEHVSLPPDAIERQPPIALSAIATPDGFRQFMEAFAWYVETIRAS